MIKQAFKEVSLPVAVFDLGDILAVYHACTFQTNAKDAGRSCLLSLYKKDSTFLQTQAFRYSINHISRFSESALLVSTGSYDGGYCFEGELFIWDIPANSLTLAVSDNREFLSAEIMDGNLLIECAPPVDDDDTLCTDVYSFPLPPEYPVKLPPATAHHEFYWHNYNIQTEEAVDVLTRAANDAGHLYKPYTLAHDVTVIDESTIAVALADATIVIAGTERTEEIKLPGDGNCTQIFYNKATDTLEINLLHSERSGDKPSNTLYTVNLNDGRICERMQGSFTLSKCADGELFGRQTRHQGKEKDFILDENYEKSFSRRIGHYDLFNHFIRIDGQENFFALVGRPADQHKNKELVELSKDGKILSRIDIDPGDNHYMNLNGILSGDSFVLSAKVYNSNPYNRNFILFSLDKKGQKGWQIKTTSNVTALIAVDTDTFAAAFRNGEITLYGIKTGKVKKSLKNTEYPIPLSLAYTDGRLAAGYDTGDIDLFIL